MSALSLWQSKLNHSLKNCCLLRSQVHLPAVPLLIQFPENMPGETAEDGPSTWVPVPTWEKWKKLLVQGFSLLGNESEDRKSLPNFLFNICFKYIKMHLKNVAQCRRSIFSFPKIISNLPCESSCTFKPT